jgi:hypothetical protein
LHVTRAGIQAATALASATQGIVAGVHARAVNIALDGGPVVTLLPASKPLHPWGLQVDSGEGPFAARVQPMDGAAVRVAGGAMQIGAARVEFAAAAITDLGLRIHSTAAIGPEARSTLAACILAVAPRGPFEAAFARALSSFEQGGAVAGLLSLVGLGEGFTPAGDDALVGVFAGLDLLTGSKAGVAAERAALAAALPMPLSERTTRLSAQMLAAAVLGQYAEPLLRLLEVLGNRDRLESRHPALLELAGMGQRSGIDTLRGLLAVLKRHRRRVPAGPGNQPNGSASPPRG